jgi:hypothetical protein
MRRRRRFNPKRIRHRTADERYHRKVKAGVLKTLEREIRQSKKGA